MRNSCKVPRLLANRDRLTVGPYYLPPPSLSLLALNPCVWVFKP
jgi:hypothetical protein